MKTEEGSNVFACKSFYVLLFQIWCAKHFVLDLLYLMALVGRRLTVIMFLNIKFLSQAIPYYMPMSYCECRSTNIKFQIRQQILHQLRPSNSPVSQYMWHAKEP